MFAMGFCRYVTLGGRIMCCSPSVCPSVTRLRLSRNSKR